MRRAFLVVLAALSVFAVACGKKGPPLAPIIRIPAVVEKVSTERVGNDIYLTVTIPSVNVDMSTPIDIGHVDVYAITAEQQPARTTFVDNAVLVARVPVAPVTAPGAPPDAAPASDPAMAVTGATVTVVDRLTAESLTPKVVPAEAGQPGPPPVAGALRRFYVAVPFSTRNRPGPQMPPHEVVLAPLPAAPVGLVAGYTAADLTLSWTMLAVLPEVAAAPALQAPPASPAPSLPPTAAPAPAPVTAPLAAPVSAAAVPAAARFNVYRVAAPGTVAPTAGGWRAVRPRPLNAAPLERMTFSEPVMFGMPRCYQVRAVLGTGANQVESEPSAIACVTAVDTFAPAPPGNLVAVASGTSISLLWEPGTEPDLAGYVVYRGAAGSAALQRLTPMPVTDARFVDTTAVSGMRYVYAVAAVDAGGNTSGESNRIEETAR